MSSLCRLCVNGCNGGYKNLYDDRGHQNETYSISVKYFDPMLFDVTSENHPRVIVCLQCWFHIIDFHNFHESVMLAQKLLEDKNHNILLKEQDELHTEKAGHHYATSDVSISYDVDMDEENGVPVEECNETATDESFYDDIVVKEEEIISLPDQLDIPEIDITEYPADQHVSKNNNYRKEEVTKQKNSDEITKSLEKTRFDCKVCGNFFERRFNYSRHMVRQHGYTEEDVSRDYIKDKLNKLKRNPLHPKPKVIQCKLCGRYVFKVSNLIRHMRNQHNIPKKNISLKDIVYVTTNIVPDNCESHHQSPEDPISYKNNNMISTDNTVQENDLKNEHVSDTSKDGYFNDDHEATSNGMIEIQSLKEPFHSDSNEISLPESLLKVNEAELIPTDNVFKLFNQQRKISSSIRTQNLSRRKWTTQELDDYIAKWKPKLKCRLCNRTYASFTLLKGHYRVNHPKEECYVACCTSKFKARSQLVQHIHVHANPNVFQCEFCERTFTTAYILQTHIFKKHKILADKTYISPDDICNRKKTIKQDNSTNVNLTQLEIQRPINDMLIVDPKSKTRCKFCGKHFTNQQLKRHMVKQHNITLDHIKVLENEVPEHNPNDNNSNIHGHDETKSFLGCKICGKHFPNRYNLYGHLFSEHSISKNDVSSEHYEKFPSKDAAFFLEIFQGRKKRRRACL